MRNYDVTLIFSPLLAEEEANAQFQEFVSFVQEQGGILGNQRLLGKRTLLAPIKGVKEGYLATIAFALSPDKLSAIEKACRDTQSLLRSLLMVQPKKSRKGAVRLAPEPSLASAQRKEEKVNLKDIDEKLEEIFKE